MGDHSFDRQAGRQAGTTEETEYQITASDLVKYESSGEIFSASQWLMWYYQC